MTGSNGEGLNVTGLKYSEAEFNRGELSSLTLKSILPKGNVI